MLYFSKFKIIFIYIIIFILSFFSLTNFVKTDNENFFFKKINLGLDLQGGSYLLLEVDTKPVVKEKLQNKLLSLRKFLKSNDIKYKNLNIENEVINFQIINDKEKEFENYFLSKNSTLNPYFNKYKSHEMDYNSINNSVKIKYSKYGIIELKNSSLTQSLEIVRKRIDEIGTKEPTMVKRGVDRILIELPGLDDPNRIKKLLGKTANLTFRLITEEESEFGSEFLLDENNN